MINILINIFVIGVLTVIAGLVGMVLSESFIRTIDDEQKKEQHSVVMKTAFTTALVASIITVIMMNSR